MLRTLLVLALGFAAWKYAYLAAPWLPNSLVGLLPSGQTAIKTSSQAPHLTSPTALTSPQPSSFRCDGRQYCSQMTSCAEATQFLRNCPGMKMDGDGDGVPCEQQWCR